MWFDVGIDETGDKQQGNTADDVVNGARLA
jgi:hypothetical protein